MINPYENIIIGNFLYSLGRAMGMHPKGAGVEGVVNLLQQTPLDPVLGDVMLHFPAVWRLIEFKRTGAAMDKEYVKYQMLHAATKRRPRLREACRRLHWYVVSGPQDVLVAGDPKEFAIRVRPYLDLHDTGGITLEKFIQSIVEEACSDPILSTDELDLCLKIIQTFGSLKGLHSSGLLVGVGGSGGLTYVPITDISDLRGTASMLRERLLAAALQREESHTAFSNKVRQAMLERESVRSRSYESGLTR